MPFCRQGRDHPKAVEPSRGGDSIGRFDATGLTIDTTGFDDLTWLNSVGKRHGDKFRMAERIEPSTSPRSTRKP